MDDQPVPLQNWRPFWLVDSKLWPHSLWRKELGRRPGGFISNLTLVMLSGRLRAAVGLTLLVSWWMASLMPLGEPGNQCHPSYSPWGDSKVRSILSKTWAKTENLDATASWLLPIEHCLKFDPLSIIWQNQLFSGGGSIVGGVDDLWAVGGGDGQAASGITQVQYNHLYFKFYRDIIE